MRLEVARKLRESRSFVDGLGRCGMTQNVLDTFERILECVGYETGNVFDFLADLVEPVAERTCRAEQDYEAMDDGIPDCRIWRCECGEKFPFWRGLKPIYCPLCGAKVIKEES